MSPELPTPARGDIEAVLASEDPSVALSHEVRRLLAQGWSPDDLVSLLEEVRESLRLRHRDQDEDVVLEVMDSLTGWTGPTGKL